MPDMNRTSASANAATLENVASKPTKTRWLVLVLISFMYLITYMDRSNISVAQPEIAKTIWTEQDRHGPRPRCVYLGLCAGAIPGRMVWRPLWPQARAYRHHVLWSATAVMTGAALGFGSLFGARFLLGWAKPAHSQWPAAECSCGFHASSAAASRAPRISSAALRVAITPFIAGSILLRLRMARNFLHFRIAGRGLGDCLQRLLPQSFPRTTKASTALELAHIRGVNPDGSIKPPAITEARRLPGNKFCSRPTCGSSLSATSVSSFGTNFYLTWYPTYLREHLHMSIQLSGHLGIRFLCLREWPETWSAARSPT